MRGMHRYRGRHGKRDPRLGRVAFRNLSELPSLSGQLQYLPRFLGRLAGIAKKQPNEPPPLASLGIGGTDPGARGEREGKATRPARKNPTRTGARLSGQ